MRALFFGLLLVSCTAAIAAPGPVPVDSGKPKALIRLAKLDTRECKIKPEGTVHIEVPPQHGKAEIKLEDASGQNSKCGNVSGKVIRIFYTSKKGYKGSDQIEFAQVIEPDQSDNGARVVRKYRIPIEVR